MVYPFVLVRPKIILNREVKQKMRIYVYTSQFYFRPRNTDWLYNHLLARMPEFNPELDIYLQQSTFCSVIENLRGAASILRNRVGLPVPRAWMTREESSFSRRDVRHAKPDIVYGQSPNNICTVPVIFNCGPTYANRLREKGVAEAAIRREQDIKRRCATRATLVTSHSVANLENLAEYMPEVVGKMRCLPFFLPYLVALSEEQIIRKFSAKGPLKLLFVGREARRKGLPEVLDAVKSLSAKFPGKFELTIVSNFADGLVDVPDLPNVKLLGEAPRSQVRELLEVSHMQLMPSHFESYGWIYLEAMANGCIPMACDQPTQREILDSGRAGLLVRTDGAKIEDALTLYMKNPDRLLPLAMNASRRCRTHYLPDVVAREFKALGMEAVDKFGKL